MKKIFTLLALIAIASMLSLGAKNIKTVEISPDNTLCDQVTPEFGDVDSLILTGYMNHYPDFKVIDSLATFHNLTGLNLSDCSMGDDALPPYALSSGFRKFIVDGEDVYQANHLYYVTLPKKLRILGECCFYYSTIKCIDIPNTVNTLRINAFKGCRELESIVIPEGVPEVADECFCNCPKLRNVSLPSSCKRILSYAFAFNENLKTIRLPEGLEEIYPFSFFSSGLEMINIPSSVQTIYFQAFNDCKKLKTIYLHEGLQMFFMGYQFANLTSLESFYCDIKEPVLFEPGSNPFVGTDQTKAILYVPVGSKEKYEAAQYWQDFDNIVEMDMTGISTVKGDRQVTGVRYYNLAGVESAEPQQGVNIKVTTYSSAYPTQLTSVKRALEYHIQEMERGGNGAMRPPGPDFPLSGPDTHEATYFIPNYCDFAETNYSYDAHGNLSSVRLPAPSRSDTTRIWYSYDYEDVLNTHISRVTDAFSLSNIVDDYDFRYGVSRHGRDRNHQQSWTSYDNLGRMTGVRTPFDGPYGNTISFSYHQIADTANGVISTPAYSVTTYYFRNYDITGNESYAFTDTMRVVTFVDGFGRPVQVRKDGVVWDGSHNVDRVIVTGRTMYDCYGRAVRSYHPSTSSSSTVMAFEPGAQSVEFFTETEYDELDRPLKVTLPDTTNTSYAYSLVGNALKTTVTDAEGNSSATLTNGSGKTVQSIQYKGGPDSEALTTAFAYDGIGRLVSVTDTEGNVTESTYDYGDRRTRVVHPASGETNYTYDRLGNVLTVQTANLKDGGSRVEYTYDRGRPTSVVYPEHPENNVYYHYGTADEPDTHNDLYGRLKFVEDGSGGTEYRYDAMGNVNRMRRTLSIPGEMVATADFEWRYDSFGKLLGMTYPAIRSAYGERVAYRYDRSGQLQSVYNNNTEGYYYARDIGYDRFGSQIHMEYGNGASTDYAYIPTNRRLRNISVSTSGSSAFTFGRAYTYDRVGNILALTSSTGGTGTLFPPVSHEYRYDNLYRLVGSNGYTIDGGQMSAIDTMTMAYDDMYRITGKTLVMSQQNVQFDGTLSAGYTLGYNYNTATGRKFQMSSVTDVNYRVASATVSNSDKIDERHTYEYDKNGNITYVSTSRKREDRAHRDRTREEKFRWDEANRLLAVSQDGYVSHYFYDASGERTVKMHGGNSAVFVNSQMSGRETGALSFSAYFNPYFSIHDGTRFTKHLYIGSERIASMTGELDEDYYDVANNNNIVHAGVEVNVNTNDLHIPYTDRCYAMRDSIDGNYSYFGLHSGLDWSGVQLRALSLPCHGEEDGSVSNGGGSIPRSQGSGTGNDYPSRYGSIWYFHKDHLGSSTLITDGTGSVSQQVEYLPYGEVFLEKLHSSDPSQQLYATPYKFNGKELDEETGLYYYGARYMNPRLSIWYATDPMQEKYPNITSYAYCSGNPVKMIDPDGLDEWEINSKGDIVSHKKTKDHDAFYMVDEDKKRINGKELVFKNGKVKHRSLKSKILKKTYNLDIFEVKGDEYGTKLFEFMSDNITNTSYVEYSIVRTGSKIKGTNYISTGHEAGEEPALTHLISKELYKHNIVVREIGHGHPLTQGADNADILFAKNVGKLFKDNKKKTPKFFIYFISLHKYIYYNTKTKPYKK